MLCCNFICVEFCSKSSAQIEISLPILLQLLSTQIFISRLDSSNLNLICAQIVQTSLRSLILRQPNSLQIESSLRSCSHMQRIHWSIQRPSWPFSFSKTLPKGILLLKLFILDYILLLQFSFVQILDHLLCRFVVNKYRLVVFANSLPNFFNSLLWMRFEKHWFSARTSPSALMIRLASLIHKLFRFRVNHFLLIIGLWVLFGGNIFRRRGFIINLWLTHFLIIWF